MGSHGWILEPDATDFKHKMMYLYYHQEKDSVLSKVNNAKLTTWQLAAQMYASVFQNIVNQDRNPIRIK